MSYFSEHGIAKGEKGYQVCKICAVDTTDPLARFGNKGECNYCLDDRANILKLPKTNPDLGIEKWNKIVVKTMLDRRLGNKYDAVMGISGGIDSSYAVFKVKQYGIQALLVHVDNGFDSPEGKHNVRAVMDGSGFDFINVAPNSVEFRELELAYLKSGVMDVDIPSDEAIVSAVHRTAAEYGVKSMFSGGNYQTESFMSSAWCYRNKNDLVNIRNIYRKFGYPKDVPLKTFPLTGFFGLLWNRRVRGIRTYYPLNLLGYNKRDALATLHDAWGYKPYGDKHCENILTRWLERYFFPERWGYDKRRHYLSSLVRDGQMGRVEALDIVENQPFYPLPVTGDTIFQDSDVVFKGLGINQDWLDILLDLPRRSHKEFGSDQWLYDSWVWMLSNRFVRSMWRKISHGAD